MLLSLSRKFIFVANLKSASSTIEAALAPEAEVRLTETRFGKHDGLTQIGQRFHWVGRYVPYEEFYVFGVVRDPVDFLLSLYNSHRKDDFDGQRQSTKGMSFDDFLDVWCKRSWQAKLQRQRFTDEHQRFEVSHLILHEDLEREFPLVCKRLGLGEVALARKNLSPQVLTRDDLTEAQIAEVRSRWAEDYDWIATRPRRL